jgi:hypothetical protein
VEIVDCLVLEYFPPFMTFIPGFWSFVIIRCHLCLHLQVSCLSVEPYAPGPTVSTTNFICINLDINGCALKKVKNSNFDRSLPHLPLPQSAAKVSKVKPYSYM